MRRRQRGLVVVSDNNFDGDTFKGDVSSWIATLFYAIYCILIRKHVRVPALFFGWVGVYITAVGIPVLLMTEPKEVIAVGFSPKMLALLIFTGLFDNVLSQYFWAYSVLLTSPTVATVGLSLTIPMAIASDLYRGKPVVMQQYLSAFFVCAGFLILSAEPDSEEEDDGKRDEEIRSEESPSMVRPLVESA